MRGERWAAVKAGYKRILTEISKLKNLAVSTFTFDGIINEHIKLKTPAEALRLFDKLPCSLGDDTDYIKAMETMTSYMENVTEKYKDYCSFLIFLSDGGGKNPKESIEKIRELRKGGRKLVFYTVACNTEESEEASMLSMSKELDGEHYKITGTEGAKIIFSQILAG